MKFSIVTCTYNSAEFLQRNIDSVKQQTYRDFEHIFIDGFSSDETVAMIKAYQQEFPNQVKLFQCEPKGISDAMNQGIDHATGEYINHLHSDDTLVGPTVLQLVADAAERYQQPDWLYGKANFIDLPSGASRIIPHRIVYHRIRFWLLLLTDYVPHQAVFLKPSVFKAYGQFNTTYKNRMDYDLWLRLAKRKVKSQFMDIIVCNFTLRPQSQSVAFRFNNEHEAIFRSYVRNPLLVWALNALAKLNQQRNLF